MNTILSIITNVAFWIGAGAVASGVLLKAIIDIRKNVKIIYDNLHKTSHEIAAMCTWTHKQVQKYLKKKGL